MAPSLNLIQLFCGEGCTESVLDLYNLLTAESYYRNSACRACWISEIQYCKIETLPLHEFVILKVQHPAQESALGYMFIDRNCGERSVPTSTMASLWKLLRL